MSTPNRGKGSCECGWNDYICVCSFLEPLDEGALQRSRAFAASVNSFDFDSVSVTGQKETVPSDNEGDDDNNDSPHKNKGGEAGNDNFAAMTSTEEKNDNVESTAQNPAAVQGPAIERKRNRERKRRGDINKGFQELAKINFVIDPDLKKRALKNSAGMRSTPTDESQLIGRVELVNSAIVTLARLHQDNEVHKMLISHLTSAAGDGTHPDLNTFLWNATVPVLPSNAADNVTTSEEADEDSQKLSLSEIKRNREKKRGADIRKGLDTLSQMIHAIDPLLKTTLEEREKLLRGAGGSRSRTPKKNQQQFLSHVELVNHAVATLARIHSQNEIHKNVIARMARARASSGGARNVASSSASTIEMPPPPDHPPHGANLLGGGGGDDDDDRKMNHQYDTARESPQEQVSWNLLSSR